MVFSLNAFHCKPALFIEGQHFSLTTFHCSWYFQWLLFIAGYLKRESLLYGSAHGSGKWSHDQLPKLVNDLEYPSKQKVRNSSGM
jgi:hypothetical protein